MKTFSFIALIVLLAGCSASPLVQKITVRERVDSLIVRYDTVRVSAPSDTVFVERSTLDSSAFKRVHAKLDTTVSRVTLHAEYSYPPDMWRVQVVQQDTVVRWVIRDSLVETPYEVEVVPLWVKLVLVLAALTIVALIVKR